MQLENIGFRISPIPTFVKTPQPLPKLAERGLAPIGQNRPKGTRTAARASLPPAVKNKPSRDCCSAQPSQTAILDVSLITLSTIELTTKGAP